MTGFAVRAPEGGVKVKPALKGRCPAPWEALPDSIILPVVILAGIGAIWNSSGKHLPGRVRLAGVPGPEDLPPELDPEICITGRGQAGGD